MMTRIALALLFTVAAGCSTVLGFWFQERAVPVRSTVVEIVGAAHPGGKLLVRWEVFRERSCSATKQEFILDVNGVRWIIPEQFFKIAPGPLGADTFVSQTALPEDLPIGDAVLRVSIAYECNPVHKLWPVVNRIPDHHITISPRPVLAPVLN